MYNPQIGEMVWAYVVIDSDWTEWGKGVVTNKFGELGVQMYTVETEEGVYNLTTYSLYKRKSELLSEHLNKLTHDSIRLHSEIVKLEQEISELEMKGE